MPFKSKAQQRFMFAAEARGEVPKGTAKRWAHETKNIKNLPEYKKESAFYLMGFNLALQDGLEKEAVFKVLRDLFKTPAKGLSRPLSRVTVPPRPPGEGWVFDRGLGFWKNIKVPTGTPITGPRFWQAPLTA